MPHKALIIETTVNTLTALEVTGGPGSPEINRWASCALPPEGLTPAVVREFWRKEKFATTRAIWLLPERLVRYKTLTFMVLPEEQLTAAVKVEMDNGATDDELWRVIGSCQQDGQVLVRVVVIGNRQLTQALEAFTQAGLAINWSSLYSHGLQNFILFHRDLYETKPERFAYLYQTPDRTEYGVVTETTICYRREIAIGSDALAQAETEDVLADLMEELRLSFASSKTSGQQKTDVLWLFGVDIAVLAMLQKELTRAGLTVMLPAKTNFGGVLTQTQTSRLAPLVGLALDELGWNRIENFRFYTLEQQSRQMIRQNCRWLLQWGIVAAFLLLGGWLAVRAQLQENQAKRQWLAGQQAKLAQLRRIEALTQANLNKLTQLEQWSSGKGQELEFLLALQKQLPPRTVITDLAIEDGKVKNLAGTTPLVSLLLTRLADDPRLQVLELRGNITTTATGQEGFQLEDPDVPKEQKAK
jgi:Tfp pilus assembly protein PilN